jgi:Ca2+:H+ antiporter
MKSLFKPGIYWLFVFAPIAIGLEYTHSKAPLIFFAAALAIIPIARLIGEATEELAFKTGDAIGGLLNATFGNAPELIICVVALNAGLHNMVLASLAGAVLANLLLAQGVSFLVGGIKHHNQDYNPTSIRVYSSMMLIAVISLTIPSVFHQSVVNEGYKIEETTINIILSIMLLIGYILYLVFMIKTHPDFFRSAKDGEAEEDHSKRWTLKRAILTLLGASVAAAFMSEILVGASEQTGEALGMSSLFIGVIFISIIGGAAESISAVTMAAKNKMDLSIGIAMGSSIQIVLFIAPTLMLLSLFMGPSPMHLAFSRVLVLSMFFAVLLGTIIAGDGRSNWYKGVQLVMMYMIIGMMFYYFPE